MNEILTFVAISILIYFTIALALIFIPIKRHPSEETLDFSDLADQELLLDATQEQHHLARDKTKLFYRLISGTSNQCIVLIHGSGSEGRYLIPLAQALNKKSEITVIIPDLRGHGRSQGSSPGDVKYLGQYEHDLKDLYNHLQDSSQFETVLLGGHSSGGGLAIRYTGGSLNEFDGTILLAPYLSHTAPTVRPNSGGWVQVANLRYAGLAMFNNIGIRFLNYLPVLFFNRPVSVADELQVDSYSYRLNQSFSPSAYKAELEANRKPILLLIGVQDEAFYANEFQSVLDSHAPHAELHLFEDTKHLDLVSNKRTATLISQWLNDL